MSEVGGNAAFASALEIVSIMIALVIFLGQKYIASKTSITMSSLCPVVAKEI